MISDVIDIMTYYKATLRKDPRLAQVHPAGRRPGFRNQPKAKGEFCHDLFHGTRLYYPAGAGP